MSWPPTPSHTLPLAKPGSGPSHEHTLPIPSPHLVSQLTWVLSSGESTTTVSPFVPGGVSDGQWHTVQLKYYNKVGVRGGQGSQGSVLGSGAQTKVALHPGGWSWHFWLKGREGGANLPLGWAVPLPPPSSARYSASC